MILDKNFFNIFVVDFFEAIEKDFLNLMKKEKTNKISVDKFEIDVIDYIDNSKTPIMETIKETPLGIFIYVKNKDAIPTPYPVEEIFHPFSLAELADKLTDKQKYSKLLENFYVKSEELVLNYFKEKNITTLSLTEEEFELLAITKSSGVYQVGEGIVTEISIINNRVFFTIKTEEEEQSFTAHIVECNAADLAMILSNLLFPQ